MLVDYVRLGMKNLRHRQLRSLLTMIGIFIGIATVVSLVALGAGLKAAIAGQFSNLGTDRLIVSAKGGDFGPPGQNTAVELTEADLRVVQRSAYVELATGRMLEPVQMVFNDKRNLELVASLPDDPQERKLVLSVINADPVEGRMPKRGDGYVAAVGSDFSTGDSYGKPIHAGDNIYLNGKKVEVIGVLERRGSVEDDGIFMNEQAIREIAGVPERYSLIVAQMASEEDIPLASESIAKNLRSSRNVKERKEDFTIQTPGDVLDTFNTVIGGVTWVLVGIAGISLIVGGIGIMNTMYTSVLERTREIGIMKAVGARNSDILAIFIFESGLLGLVGGIIGVILGYLLSKAVVIAGSAALGPGILGADVGFSLVGGALLFSFLVGAIAGAFPAYEASRMPPVEALQQ